MYYLNCHVLWNYLCGDDETVAGGNVRYSL